MKTATEEYCMVHLVGNFSYGGGVMMIDRESVKKIRCFICGKRVPSDEIIVMSFTQEDMVCVCKHHLKFRYPPGTFDEIPQEVAER